MLIGMMLNAYKHAADSQLLRRYICHIGLFGYEMGHPGYGSDTPNRTFRILFRAKWDSSDTNFISVFLNVGLFLFNFAEPWNQNMRNCLPRRTDEERDLASREVVQSYIATTAMYDFNVYEKRVLYNLVKLAQSQIQGIRLSDNLYRIEHAYRELIRIELPISDFLINREDKHHARVKEALQSLHRKTFSYRDAQVWECFSIIANPKIELRSSRVSFYVNAKVWDVLLDFSKGFSRYDLEVAFSLESPYSMRFYEMLCGQESPINLPIEALRRVFQLEGRYAMTKDFIRRVIVSAQKELNAKSPVTFTFQTVKEGKKISQIVFFPVRQPRKEGAKAELHRITRKYGYGCCLNRQEREYLYQIGFNDSGIRNNLDLFMQCQKVLDLPLELAIILGKSRTKKNPCGWCIRTLKGKLSDRL